VIRLESPEDLRTASVLARAVTLRDVALSALNVKRHVRPNVSSLGTLKTELRDEASAEVAADGADLWVIVSLWFSAGRVDATTAAREEVITAMATFDLQYQRVLPDTIIGAGDAEVFARINGTYNAWPYFREILSNSLVRLGYPPFTLESMVVGPRMPPPGATGHAAKPRPAGGTPPATKPPKS